MGVCIYCIIQIPCLYSLNVYIVNIMQGLCIRENEPRVIDVDVSFMVEEYMNYLPIIYIILIS